MGSSGINKTSTSYQNLSHSTIKQYTYTSFYDNFHFNNIQDYDYEFRKHNLPQLFILPPFFSRFDDPVSYAFRSDPTKKTISTNVESENLLKEQENHFTKEDSNNPELIRSMRQERSSQAILVSFKIKAVPSSKYML